MSTLILGALGLGSSGPIDVLRLAATGRIGDVNLNTDNTSPSESEKSNTKNKVTVRRKLIAYDDKEDQFDVFYLSNNEYTVGWIADHDVKSCMSCDVTFGTLKRKHHCRACGQVVCNKCSQHKLKIPELAGAEKKGSRVCASCFTETKKRNGKGRQSALNDSMDGEVTAENTPRSARGAGYYESFADSTHTVSTINSSNASPNRATPQVTAPASTSTTPAQMTVKVEAIPESKDVNSAATMKLTMPRTSVERKSADRVDSAADTPKVNVKQDPSHTTPVVVKTTTPVALTTADDTDSDEEGSVSEGEFAGEGEIYDGEYKDGMKHGRGKLRMANGDVYEGEFKEDQMHGRGMIKYQNGDTFDGKFQNGVKNGRGVFKSKLGAIYDGEYSDDLRNGRGMYTSTDGGVYEGGWKNDVINGRGVYNYASSDVYDGEFKNGKKHGKGLFKSADGDVYRGHFVDGLYEGNGHYKYGNSDVYEGEFKANKRHGAGVMKYSSGDVYDGEFQNDKKHGTGLYVFSNDEVYEGQYENDLRCGQGVLLVAKKVIYDGLWKNDKPVS